MSRNPSQFESPDFLHAVLSGKADLDEIEDYIEAWHDAPDDSEAASLEVYEFLGLTWEEYALWGERPESLRFVVAAHANNIPMRNLLHAEADVLAAARSGRAEAASRVIEWLEHRDKLPSAKKA